MDFSGMPSLNILQWYDLFFEEMEATSTLLLTRKKKWLRLLIGFLGNGKKILPTSWKISHIAWISSDLRHKLHLISLEYKNYSDMKMQKQ